MDIEGLTAALLAGHDTLYLAKIRYLGDDEAVEPYWFMIVTARGNNITFEGALDNFVKENEGIAEVSFMYRLGPIQPTLEKMIGDKKHDDATRVGT